MKRILCFSVALVSISTSCLLAQTTWQTAGGTWQDGAIGGFDTQFDNGDSVLFGDTGVGAVNISGTVQPSTISITNSAGSYTFSGGTIGGTGTTLSKSGAGTAIIDNNVTLSHTGNTTISGGILQFNRNTATGIQNIGSGSVQLQGGQLNLAGGASSNYTVQNNFSVNASGGTIDFSRVALNPVWLLTGSLDLGGNLTLTSAGGGSATGPTFFSGGITVNTNATITASNGSNGDMTLGALSGSSERVLKIQNSSTNGRGISLSASNSLSGAVELSGSSVAFVATNGGFNFSAAPSGNGLNIQTRDNALLNFTYAVAGTSDLSNITTRRGGGIRASGASGTLVGLGSNVTNYVGEGGGLVLNNSANLNNNRLSDSAAVAMSSSRFTIVGRTANTSPTNEVIGTLSATGSSLLYLDETNTTDSGVDLTVTTLTAPSGKGNTLLIQTDSGDFGVGAGSSTVTVTGSGVNKPTVTNGMITPAIQQMDVATNAGHFLTFSGNDLITAQANYTDYAADWSGALSTQIANLTAAITLSSGVAAVNVYALRINGAGSLNQNLNGRTVNIGSGGIIMSNNQFTNGTLNFGTNHGYIGAYNGASQGSISATLSGTNGITFFGASQSIDLGGANDFTGGLYINGGRVTLNTATAANGNDVTVNALGELNIEVATTTGAVIGGLSGSGRVSADFQSTGQRYLAITPTSGTHTFNGIIANGAGGKVLNVLKEGAGTQVFGTDSVATYTGTTQVNNGTLRINGDFSGATGAVTVAGTATLSGSGTIGGATTISGVHSPGNSPGLQTFASDLNYENGSSFTFELAANSTSGRGTNFDGVNVGGNLDFDPATAFNLTFNSVGSTVDWSNALWSSNQQWLLWDVAGVTTDFSTLSLTAANWADAQGDLFNTVLSGSSFSLSLTGNDIYLNYTAIPEPGTYVLLLGGLAALFFRRRPQG